MKRKAVMLLAAATLGVMLTACGGGEEAKKEEKTETPVIVMEEPKEEEPVQEEAEPEAEPQDEEFREGYYRSELTNEWIDESLRNQRPIAAMVDNESTALPHFGVNDCDIVYEMTNSKANGGITRLMCIAKDWGSIAQLGSIRSVRPTNLQIAPEYGAVVCHDGGPEIYINTFLKLPFCRHLSGGFKRIDNGKAREYTEYITTGEVASRLEKEKISSEYETDYYQGGSHFNFASESDPVDLSSASGSKGASDIALPFKHNSSKLKYDSGKGLYMYSEYGSAHVDGKTGEQTGFKNVILLSAKMNVFDDNGYMQFNVIEVKDRDGFYCTNGSCIPIKWSKDNDLAYTRYYDESGSEIKVNTGKTYIAIIPSEDFDSLTID